MKKVYIASALRTAVGSFGGSLSTVSPSTFAAEVVKQIVAKTGIQASDIDELVSGNILPAGQGQSVGRQIVIKAGLSIDTPAYTLNMACGSGLRAVMNAYCSIVAGQSKMIIAGGTESMSQSPYLLPKDVRVGIKMGEFKVIDHMIYDALTDYYNNYHMGITAENVAEKHKIGRQEQDEFAYNSQLKAKTAIDNGLFKDEIVPVQVQQKKETVTFEIDEFPRLSPVDKLATLKPVFKKDGTVTAANASGLNDAAAFLLVVDEEMLSKYNLKPLAEIVAMGQGGVAPEVMGLGPVPAVRQALKNSGLKLKDMDVIELNEAFAAQSLGVIKEWSQEHGMSQDEIIAKLNPRGGAIALGHPVGASGARVLTTLVHQIKGESGKLGIASLCIGGGMGVALIVKAV